MGGTPQRRSFRRFAPRDDSVGSIQIQYRIRKEKELRKSMGSQARKIFLLWILVTTLLLLYRSDAVSAKERKNKVGFLIGQWQPNLIRDEKPVSVFGGTANSSPYLGINYERIIWKNISTHLSLGYWSHLYDNNNQTVSIMPIEFGIEHELIENFPISPYVLYGMEVLFGKTAEGNRLKKIGFDHFSHTALGVFLITGIRLAPLSNVEMVLNFGYIYARFSENMDTIEDYSGLRATVGINYLF